MADAKCQNTLAGSVQTLRILVAAMVLGCVIFAVVAAVISWGHEPSSTPIVTYIALGLAAWSIISRLIGPRLIVAMGRKRLAQAPATDESSERDKVRLLQLAMAKTLIGAAMFEGAAFFLLIAYMIERSPIALGVAGVFIFALALHWPTQSSIEAWIDDQLRLLREDRQQQGRGW